MTGNDALPHKPQVMENYPVPAREKVEQLTAAAAARPHDAIAFQGAPGAYSHLAARQAYPLSLPLPCFSFEDAFAAVQDGRAELAVIPIENSQAGRVADIHFLLPESDLKIVGEHFLRVRHCLLAPKGAQLAECREAMSHQQALSQCRASLRNWSIRPVQYADTAGAAALVADRASRGESQGLCAIASSLAGEMYGLDVLAEGIEDVSHNTTRFVILAREAAHPVMDERKLMTSILFEVKSVPAALFKALSGFATNGVNLTKLESYMVGGTFNAALFYCDIEGSPRMHNVAMALEDLQHYSKQVRVLGTYPQARDRFAADSTAAHSA